MVCPEVAPAEQQPPHPYRSLRYIAVPSVYPIERAPEYAQQAGVLTDKDKLAIHLASCSPCPLPDSRRRGHSVELGTFGASRDPALSAASAPAMEGRGVVLGKSFTSPRPHHGAAGRERCRPAQQARAPRGPSSCFSPTSSLSSVLWAHIKAIRVTDKV